MTGLIGFASGYHAMQSCDTLLMLGTDFPYRQFYPEEARGSPRSTSAPRPSAAARRSSSVWSARSGRRLRALLPRLTSKTDRKHPRRVR